MCAPVKADVGWLKSIMDICCVCVVVVVVVWGKEFDFVLENNHPNFKRVYIYGFKNILNIGLPKKI